MTQLQVADVDEGADWASVQLRQGKIVAVAGTGDGSAVGVLPLAGTRNHVFLYDRRTGERVKVTRDDREYQLAKMRPVDPKVKGSQYERKWVGGYLVANVDIEPVFTETPSAMTGRVERVAPNHGSKRSRRRGKRGRGGRQ